LSRAGVTFETLVKKEATQEQTMRIFRLSISPRSSFVLGWEWWGLLLGKGSQAVD